MLKTDERGSFNSLVLPFIVVVLLAIGFGVFSVWAFTNYNEQKNNVDAIVSVAVSEAEQEQESELRAQFAEEMKSPYKTYISPSALGSVKIVYPKSWSAYVQEQETGSVKLEGYFQPNFVPDAKSDIPFATRVSLDNNDYPDELDKYQKSVEKGDLRATAITISGVKGTRLDGTIEKETVGAIVLLPLRERTLKVWTESTNYMADFNKVIDSLTYSP